MAWVSPETLEQWEERSNRTADKVMLGAAKVFWMRRTVLSPDAFMDTGYILRYIGIITGFVFGLQVGAQLVVIPLTWTTETTVARSFHLPGPTAAHCASQELFVLTHIMPWTALVVSVFMAGIAGIIVPRAYFWNRRARHLHDLHTNPLPTQAIPDPSVWPPPPRITE